MIRYNCYEIILFTKISTSLYIIWFNYEGKGKGL